MNSVRTSLDVVRGIAAVVVIALILIVALQLRTNAQQPSAINGTSAALAASPSPEPTATEDPIDLAPAAPPAAPAGECVTYNTTYDSLPRTPENLASISTRVVAATVQEVGPARWKNDSETPPTERQDLTGDAVMRLIRLSIDQDLGGGKATGMIVVWVPGGAIGCHTFSFEGYPADIKPGQKFALFLDDRQPPIKTLGGVSRVMEMWPIKGASATSPEQGSLPLSEIESIASKALPQAP